MNKTPIEWCDFTVNPFRFRNLETGKVGPGREWNELPRVTGDKGRL